MSALRWKAQWLENGDLLVHVGCLGRVFFARPDSKGTPTVATCARCSAAWRRAYGWQQERCTGKHLPGLLDPPNLRPDSDVFPAGMDPIRRREMVSHFELTREADRPEDPRMVCGITVNGILVDIYFTVRAVGDELVLEPDEDILDEPDRKTARAKLSDALGVLGDLAWAAWLDRHPESGE